MDKRSRRTAITADYVLDVIKGTIERCQSGADYNPGAVLKGAELLGRHLRLFASFAPTTRCPSLRQACPNLSNGFPTRSEGSRVGTECVITCVFRWSPYPKKTNNPYTYERPTTDV